MRLLVWHWGRNGAGPRYAAMLARALAGAGVETMLSLPEGAELMRGSAAPALALPVRTYENRVGFLARLVALPLSSRFLARRLRRLRPDLAVCAMPALLDLGMAMALRHVGVRFAVVVHDAHPHPGERVPLQHRLQRALLRRAAIVITLGASVEESLRKQGQLTGREVLRSFLPPLAYGAVSPMRAPGPPRLLFFGRLLAYKGLDLLAEAWSGLGERRELRVVGRGPETPELERLRRLPGVRVENRWVPEAEMEDLLAWCDAVVLPYRAATQSGVAAAALAAGRRVLATRVGDLEAQLEDRPGVILCAPESVALRHGILALEALPPPAPDTDAEWREMALALAEGLTRC